MRQKQKSLARRRSSPLRQFHDGLGFLLSHLMITNIFEYSLQLVNPKLTVPYWDFTIETSSWNTEPYDISRPTSRSPLLQPSWFGTYDQDDYVVGRPTRGSRKRYSRAFYQSTTGRSPYTPNYNRIRKVSRCPSRTYFRSKTAAGLSPEFLKRRRTTSTRMCTAGYVSRGT